MVFTGSASAHPEATGDPAHDQDLVHQLSTAERDPSAALQALDEHVNDVVSAGPSARRGKVKDLDLVGRGDRLVPNATTDVWVHDGFAYLGTFNAPCGTGEGFVSGVGRVTLGQDVAAPGVPFFDVRNVHKPTYVGNLPSVRGSRINDVKLFTASDGRDVLVHSNEPCGGGPGGFEVYDMSDARAPVHLASVRVDELNQTVSSLFASPITDVGVHNLYLFSRDGRDYVAAQVESQFDNFRIFEITDPTAPALVTAWGAEELFDAGVGDSDDPARVLDALLWLNSGFGASQNRFLHDFWVAEDGSHAYLANWDAGLVRLDLTDLTNPTVVSVALDPTSEDGEVNSHSVWPSEDGRIVVEGEEDFAPFRLQLFVNQGLLGIFDAAEAVFTPPVADLPDRAFAGDTVYVGRACTGGPAVPAGDGDDIAVVERGDCTFVEKVQNIQDAGGYAGVVIFNAEAGGDALLTPGGEADLDLPTIFVGRSAGLALLGVDSVDDLEPGVRGEAARGESTPDGWSGLRIWDYSDPANPVLASTFNTTCSADPVADVCDPRGTYSSHNMIVETRGNQVLAYVSWYSEGVVVVDVTDPYAPVEVARYNPMGAAFEQQNAGIQDVWGISKEPNKPFLYASDRNGGLYVLQMKGGGRLDAPGQGAAGGKGQQSLPPQAKGKGAGKP
jgi:hypothetical protein